MKKIISILGAKGGSGKTTTAQMAAQGLVKLGHVVGLITTDPLNREIDDTRGYVNYDGMSPDKLEKSIEEFMSYPEGNKLAILVIDGAASDDIERTFDIELAANSDLAVLPFMDSPLDLDQARDDLVLIPNAYGLPNRWPIGHMAQEDANRELAERLEGFESRLLAPNYECRSTKKLLSQQTEGVSSVANRHCRALAIQFLEKMNLNPFKLEIQVAK